MMMYHHTPSKTGKIENIDSIKCLWRCRETWFLIYSLQELKMVLLSGKLFGNFYKTKHIFPIYLSNHTPGAFITGGWKFMFMRSLGNISTYS